MNEFEGEVLRLLGHILKEIRSKNEDSFVDMQKDEPIKKQASVKTEDIGDELADMFGDEIFIHLEVQGDKVQIIKYISNTKKWNAINNFLREYGYKYKPVEKGLGSWQL